MKEQFYNTKIDTTGQLEEVIELVEKLGFECWHGQRKEHWEYERIMYLYDDGDYVSGYDDDDDEFRLITIEELRNALK